MTSLSHGVLVTVNSTSADCSNCLPAQPRARRREAFDSSLKHPPTPESAHESESDPPPGSDSEGTMIFSDSEEWSQMRAAAFTLRCVMYFWLEKRAEITKVADSAIASDRHSAATPRSAAAQTEP